MLSSSSRGRLGGIDDLKDYIFPISGLNGLRVGSQSREFGLGQKLINTLYVFYVLQIPSLH